MNITVFTDESGVKLPEIKKWKNSLGRRKALEKEDFYRINVEKLF